MHAAFLLTDALLQDIVDIMLLECLLEALFAGRIDALADQQRLPAKLDRVGVGGHAGDPFVRQRDRGKRTRKRNDFLDIGRCRAAASAHDTHALPDIGSHIGGEFVRQCPVDRFPVGFLRQTGVRLEQHRNRSVS